MGLVTTILSNLNRFTIFFTARFLRKFAVKCILNIPPHLAYVATLHCGTLMSAKQDTNDKLQCSVTTLCLRKKQDTKLLPITSRNVNRFSNFFHW